MFVVRSLVVVAACVILSNNPFLSFSFLSFPCITARRNPFSNQSINHPILKKQNQPINQSINQPTNQPPPSPSQPQSYPPLPFESPTPPHPLKHTHSHSLTFNNIHPIPSIINLPLRTPAPHALHQPIPLRQPIQTVVPLAHGAHEAAQRVHLVLPRVPAVLVHLADGDLHRGVVLGFDDAVGRGAFAGDVAVGFWRKGEGVS